MTLLLFAIAIQQSKDAGPPILPVASAKWFQESVARIEEAVSEGDWAEAARLAKRLPATQVVVQWDDSAVPQAVRPFIRTARDEAVEEWVKSYPELKVSFAQTGNLKVSFVKELPPASDSQEPQAAVFLYSPAPEDPVIEAVFALKRGTLNTEPTDVRNELVYAIGSLLGAERNPKPGALMYRTEGATYSKNKVGPSDVAFIKKIANVSERIRTSVAAKKDPGVRPPQIFIDPRKLLPKPVPQGGEMLVAVQVSNRGKGRMQFRAVPDCGCFVIGPYRDEMEPGETVILPVKINTIEFVGKLRKTLYIYSNDPEQPVVPIPLEAYVRPAYRFIDQFEGTVAYMGPSGVVFETVLAIDPSVSIKVKKIATVGISAAVDFEPWTGTVKDPDSDLPPEKMSGYLIKVLVAPGLVTGRGGVGLQVTTDHELFKSIDHSVTIQTGIAAVPASIYFGNLTNKPARASLVITRPGRPYKVARVDSDTEFVSAHVEPYQGAGNYRVVAVYSGKASIGRFFGKITVHTDDPSEPLVTIPVEGHVK